MATRIQLDFPSLTVADYDSVCEALNFPSDWPDGLLAHGSAEVGGGMRVVDVWESTDQFEQFVQARLEPAIGQALGDRAERPERSDQELNTFYTR